MPGRLPLRSNTRGMTRHIFLKKDEEIDYLLKILSKTTCAQNKPYRLATISRDLEVLRQLHVTYGTPPAIIPNTPTGNWQYFVRKSYKDPNPTVRESDFSNVRRNNQNPSYKKEAQQNKEEA